MADIARTLRQFAYKTGGPFPLASGGTSDEYLDVKNAVLHPAAGPVLAGRVAALVCGDRIDAVAGVLVGGALLAKDVAGVLVMPCLAVRTEPKDHGLPEPVLGLDNVKGERTPHVVLVEDVVTRGTSVLKALFFLSQYGVRVDRVIAVCDREQGGLDAIRKVHPDLKVEALTTLSKVRRA